MCERNYKIYICRCEDITREEILSCIREGYQTLDEIKRVNRAGMGACQGRTCRNLIAKELAEIYRVPVSEILKPSFRPPSEPVFVGVLADAHEESLRKESDRNETCI